MLHSHRIFFIFSPTLTASITAPQMFYESLTFVSEVVLSAYPILIKKVPASLSAQITMRMITFALLAAVGAALTGSPLLHGSTIPNIIGPGLLNLIHVGSSYTAFTALPAGNAMALFYTYPVWNILGAALAFKETIDKRSIPWIAVAIIGGILLAQPTETNWNALGVIAALVAALTETGIYLWFRKDPAPNGQPWTTMARMYGGSALLLIPLFLLGFLAWGKMGTGAMSSMLLFNAFIGFIGYALRFYTIPKVSTVTFSAISFFGIVSAYLFGWGFVGEVPKIQQAIGALLVIAANVFLLKKED